VLVQLDTGSHTIAAMQDVLFSSVHLHIVGLRFFASDISLLLCTTVLKLFSAACTVEQNRHNVRACSSSGASIILYNCRLLLRLCSCMHWDNFFTQCAWV
jgi:hypothetical protein